MTTTGRGTMGKEHMRKPCHACKGSGRGIPVTGRKKWAVCAFCEGAGVEPSQEESRAIHARAYPGRRNWIA